MRVTNKDDLYEWFEYLDPGHSFDHDYAVAMLQERNRQLDQIDAVYPHAKDSLRVKENELLFYDVGSDLLVVYGVDDLQAMGSLYGDIFSDNVRMEFVGVI